ncbi:hypothetical protein EPH95_04785 [Salicibibacter halophilus]|uniref:Myb-like domain-containing protein n=1 Tax=Salicibibacter halophilus TaxID=2502791 RepID=A0A514LFE0_9BACI|nr:hypothetical protein [Salicibibacter halophilus]QDI90578.1 hypothetical protein EPH95_04785 [Salicibibacter halophilus]
METKEARRIVSLLADGKDPRTRKMLPDNNTYQNPDTVRALFIAVKGLERLERYETRALQLPENAGKSWTDEEDETLAKAYENGTSIKQLASRHKRTEGSIQARLIKLDKILFV